jgi:type II secretory ATPase GspE/PulE/Tfp pilus assembly ATPase PilB-like protein
MTPGTSVQDDASAPAVSSFDEIEAGPMTKQSSLEETLPPPSASRPAPDPEALRAQLEVNTAIPLPSTAAELPDALDDVLSSVTNDLIDNVELANLSGNRTEISFLEEIVESELALDDHTSRESELHSPAENETRPASHANTGTVEQVEPAPALQATPRIQASVPAAAVQEAPATHEVHQAPAVQPAAAQAAPATGEPVDQTVAPLAQTPAPTQAAPPSVPATKDLSVSQASVEKLNLDPSILNLATQILTQAVNSPCSDVHFEPLADGLALRFMSDGDLLDETILPAQIQGMLILCLKSMAGLDPSVIDRPQDKRFITSSFGDPVEMRITSIPGMHGEMVAVSLKSEHN